MGKLHMSGIVPEVTKPTTVEVGTIWLYEADGTFTVPKTGTYQVEMHGGGGGGGGGTGGSSRLPGGAGGGSGNLFTVELTKGDVISVTIGAGGAAGLYAGSSTVSEEDLDGKTGGTTTFGDYSLAGGGGGANGDTDSPGAASGNIAEAGNTLATYALYAVGGDGNKNNPNQTYGDGGNGAEAYGNGEAGQPGAVIVTFMGVS